MDTKVFDLSSKWTHSADFRVLPASRVQSRARKQAQDLSCDATVTG